MQRISPSALRSNIYKLLDRVLRTGEPVEIERRGRRLKIVREDGGKLDLLKPHPDYLRGDPEDIVHLDWSDEWRP